MAYAAPVAKTMSTFNSLRYYSHPALPAGHVFPDWFCVKSGVLAGRLYTDFGKCEMLATFLRAPDTVAIDSHTHSGRPLPKTPPYSCWSA
jgi:hypothetical protein